jgi:hypothetical protein
MPVQKRATIEHQTILLDGNEFIDCKFRHCKFIYKGQAPVKLEGCHLSGCTWQFEDAALRTVTLLKGLYVSGEHGKEIVETIFRNA